MLRVHIEGVPPSQPWASAGLVLPLPQTSPELVARVDHGLIFLLTTLLAAPTQGRGLREGESP